MRRTAYLLALALLLGALLGLVLVILTRLPQAVLYGLAALLPISAGIFAWWAYRKKNPKVVTVRASGTTRAPERGAITVWVEEYWRKWKWFPIFLALGIILLLWWGLWPNWWKSHVFVWPNWILVLGGFIALVVGFSMRTVRPLNIKHNVGGVLIACSIIFLLYSIGLVPFIGEKYWDDRAKKKEDEKKQAPVTAVANSSRYVVKAPVAPGWSEVINARVGQVVTPTGPILMINESGEIREDNGDGTPKKGFSAVWIRVQSRTEEPIDVTVERHSRY